MEIFTIKNWRTNEILHEGEAESFKEFVEKNKGNLKDANLNGADLEDADLEDANLNGADLEDADLKGANLKGADLEDAYLKDANLMGVNLYGANLNGANLKGADLEDANLKDADLEDAYLEKAQISIHSKWTISIEFPKFDVDNLDISRINITIGCKTKTIAEWDAWFSSNEEYETKRGTLEFRKIEAMYKAYRAYVIELWS